MTVKTRNGSLGCTNWSLAISQYYYKVTKITIFTETHDIPRGLRRNSLSASTNLYQHFYVEKLGKNFFVANFRNGFPISNFLSEKIRKTKILIRPHQIIFLPFGNNIILRSIVVLHFEGKNEYKFLQ